MDHCTEKNEISGLHFQRVDSGMNTNQSNLLEMRLGLSLVTGFQVSVYACY